MWGKIDREARSFNRIKRIAERAWLKMEYAHENPKKVLLNETAEVKWSDFTASQFVVNLIHKSQKPVSENLILKRMRENKVFTPYELITRLMLELVGEGVISSVKGKGYQLTEDMRALVEEVKETPFVEMP
jgi:hypothetical protein